MDMMDALQQAAAQRLGGSTVWQGAMRPQLPDFGAVPDLATIEQANAAAAQAAPEVTPEQRKYRDLVKAGTIDENGMTKDGKMFRGQKAKLFVAQNGGRDFVLKDKNLAAELNRITIAENRELAGLPPLEDAAPQDTADDQLRKAYPKPESMTDDRYVRNLEVIKKGKDAAPKLLEAAMFELAPESTAMGQKQADREEKRRKAMDAQARSIENARDTANSALRSIGKIRSNLGDGILPETGLVGRALSVVPGSDAYNLERDLESLKGVIGLQALGEAKAASANGASGFGALSNRELGLLQNKLGALDAGMGRERLMEALAEIEPLFQRALLRRELDDSEIDAPAQPAQAAQPPAAPKRYKFNPATGNLDPIGG